MGKRLRAVQAALHTVWAIVTALLLLLAVLITLVGIYIRMGASDATNKCRSESAVALDVAEGQREDVRSDLDETTGRMFDAAFKNDRPTLALEGEKFGELSDKLRAATDAVHVARTNRQASIDACAKG